MPKGPRWWAPHDASIPIRHGGRFVSHVTSLGRVGRLAGTTSVPRPSSATATKTVLPRSMPIVLMSMVRPLVLQVAFCPLPGLTRRVGADHPITQTPQESS
jgi:hypothetical protein